MRLKALTKYNFITIKFPIFISYVLYTAGMLIGTLMSTLFSGGSNASPTVNVDEGGFWSITIISFSIFMIIASLIGSQKETRFLISRSVSRKEIFASSAIFIPMLAAIMACLQIINIFFDAAVRSMLMGTKYLGLSQDIQHLQAPHMNNVFVFFIVSFAILTMLGAAGYLLGSLLARWKIPTIGALALLGLVYFTCVFFPEIIQFSINAFKFLFYDEHSALNIVLKQLCLAAVLILLAFPVMRRITAGKPKGN